MGQRLNIEIKSKGKILANSYYHWSAYSERSLELMKKIIDNFHEIQDDNEVIRAVKLLGLTGAGLTREAIHYAYKNIDNFDLTVDDGKGLFSRYLIPMATDRNNGLINISDKEMQDTRYWEEGRITINTDNKTFDFNVLFKMPLMTFIKEYEDVKIEKLMEFVKTTQQKSDGAFKLNNDEIGILIY